MSLAGDSITITPGSGATLATHSAGGKEHPVHVIADFDGHIVGSRPDYTVFYDPATNALNREVAELFNTSTSVIRVRGIWVIPTNTSITGIQLGFDVNRITSVGSTSSTTRTPRPMDTTYPALAAGITARSGSTAGAALDYKYWCTYIWNDELSPSTAYIPLMNQLPILGDRVAEIVLRQNQGVQVKISQLTGTAAGLTGALIYFVVDN
jgi:hypothetical protein